MTSIDAWQRCTDADLLLAFTSGERPDGGCRFQVQPAQPSPLNPEGAGWELVDFQHGRCWTGFPTMTEAMAAAGDIRDRETVVAS